MEDSLGILNYPFEFKPQIMVLKSITQICTINSMPHIWDDKNCVNRRENILVNSPNRY